MLTTTRHSIQLADGDARYRLAAWQDVMSPSGEVRMTPEEAERFTTKAHWRQIGSVLVGHVSAGDFRLVRDRAMAERIGLDHVFINVFLAGRGGGVCGRRRMRFEPGAMSITKLSSPADYRLEGITLTALVVARRVLEAAIGPVAPFDGRVYPGISIEARLVGAHIDALLALPDPLPRAQATVASRSTLALLAGCLRGEPVPDEAQAEPLDTDLELAKSIRRYIRDRLADPDLGPDLICRDFAVSRTRLYRLLRESGNVASTIRRLRLARAYGEIAAGRYAGASPAVIAVRSGFRQERSFRRAFIEEFAVSPTALQAQVGAGSLPPLPASGPVIAEWFSEL
jgi:AraC-like DNA-binding protein